MATKRNVEKRLGDLEDEVNEEVDPVELVSDGANVVYDPTTPVEEFPDDMSSLILAEGEVHGEGWHEGDGFFVYLPEALRE